MMTVDEIITRDPSVKSVLIGLVIVALLVALVAIALWRLHTPEPHIRAMGLFHCDASLRLPCDGAR